MDFWYQLIPNNRWAILVCHLVNFKPGILIPS